MRSESLDVSPHPSSSSGVLPDGSVMFLRGTKRSNPSKTGWTLSLDVKCWSLDVQSSRRESDGSQQETSRYLGQRISGLAVLSIRSSIRYKHKPILINGIPLLLCSSLSSSLLESLSCLSCILGFNKGSHTYLWISLADRRIASSVPSAGHQEILMKNNKQRGRCCTSEASL